jgi:GAF domain-containing protein
MANSQAPANAQSQSAFERAIQFGQTLIAAHPAVTDTTLQRRGQLLNAITLILTLAFVIGLLARPDLVGSFEFMLGVSICAFLLGKSKRPEFGTFLFSFGFLSTAYLSLYFGVANDYSTSVLSIVPIALIAASALVNRRVFISLALFAALAAFFAPQYSTTPIVARETMRTGGIITSIGVILFGINIFRSYLESSRVEEINVTNQKLQEVRADLKERTQAYTQELNAVTQQAQEQTARRRILVEISQNISSNINMPLNELLTSIAEVVSEKLGFYHVGIFLLDKNRQYAELRAANSEGGQRMLERRHQLKVGGTGIVGYVSQSGFPRIALSTGADAVFFNNPDLPDTRSEMAIPLKIGNLVIGVLDVQSPLPAAFSEEDTDTFNTLAGQIAFVIMHAQMSEQPAMQGERKTAQHVTARDKQKGYTYLSDGTIAAAKAVHSAALEEALHSRETVAQPASTAALPTLAIPVKIRDSVVGYIHVEAADRNRKWSEDEISMIESVSERAALALENARLFEETERRAEQEQVMAQVTARIGESSSFERILQTTIQELGRTLKARRTYIQMESVSSQDDAAADQGIQP